MRETTEPRGRWELQLPGDMDPLRRDWLGTGGSLVDRLMRLGAVSLTVTDEGERVAHEGADDDPTAFAARAVWKRSSGLYLDRELVVAAVSMATVADSLGAWEQIRGLGDRPLASILYRDTEVTRSPFAFRTVSPEHALYSHAARLWPGLDESPMWARRSVFHRQEAGLLVSECFLPMFWTKLRAYAGTHSS